MTVSHTVTIDQSGRLVIPKALRDGLAIEPGQPLRARIRDGRLEIEPEPLRAEATEVDGILVIEPQEPVAELSRAQVRDLLESQRP